MARALLFALLVATVGCGTIIKGTTQDVLISGTSKSAAVRDLGWTSRIAGAAAAGAAAGTGAPNDPAARPPQGELRVELPAVVPLKRNHMYVVDYGEGREVLLAPRWDWSMIGLNFLFTGFGLVGGTIDELSGNGGLQHVNVVQEPAQPTP